MQGTPSISSIEDDAVLGREEVATENFPLFGLDQSIPLLGLKMLGLSSEASEKALACEIAAEYGRGGILCLSNGAK